MQTLDEEEESRLADPEKWRQELIARNDPTTLNDLDGYVLFRHPLLLLISVHSHRHESLTRFS